MKFEDDFLFAKPVKDGYLEHVGQTVHWINGQAEEHNAFGKLVGEEKTRQQGWERAVYNMACWPDGKLRYKGSVNIKDFHKNVDRILAREYGMLILGIKKGEDSEYEEAVEEELGNSEKAKGDSPS